MRAVAAEALRAKRPGQSVGELLAAWQAAGRALLAKFRAPNQPALAGARGSAWWAAGRWQAVLGLDGAGESFRLEQFAHVSSAAKARRCEFAKRSTGAEEPKRNVAQRAREQLLLLAPEGGLGSRRLLLALRGGAWALLTRQAAPSAFRAVDRRARPLASPRREPGNAAHVAPGELAAGGGPARRGCPAAAQPRNHAAGRQLEAALSVCKASRGWRVGRAACSPTPELRC